MNITEIEKKIEKQKLYLNDLSLFEPYASFTRLDRENKGYLESNDIFKFLSEMYPNEVYLSWMSPYREAKNCKLNQTKHSSQKSYSLKFNLCNAIFNYFDVDNDGRLGYSDYLKLIIPIKHSSKSHKMSSKNEEVNNTSETKSKTFIRSSEFLPYEIESELAKLFELELKFQDVFERCKQDQESSSNFSVLKIFKALDPLDFGYIDILSLKEIIEKGKEAIISKDIIKAMIRKIKINGGNKLTFSEFAMLMTPANPVPKIDEAPKFVEYNPRLAALAENSSPIFSKKLYNKPPEILLSNTDRRISRPMTSRPVDKNESSSKKQLHHSITKKNPLTKNKYKTRNLKSSATLTNNKSSLNEKKPKIKKENHKVTPLRRSPDKRSRLSHEFTNIEEPKKDFIKSNIKSQSKKIETTPARKESVKKNAKSQSKIIMKQKKAIQSKTASKYSKSLAKIMKGKKNPKSIINIKTGNKKNNSETEKKQSKETKASEEERTKHSTKTNTKIEPYIDDEHNKNEFSEGDESSRSHPLRNANSARSLGINKSKYLTIKNNSQFEDPNSYLKKVSFADENLRSYREYNSYHPHQYRPQRYFPRPPLPARNECDRLSPRNISNYSSGISCSPHKSSPLRPSLMHLPDRPLVNPTLLTNSPIRYYPEIPIISSYHKDIRMQRKPYVSQTFTKPTDASLSSKFGTFDNGTFRETELERALIKLATTSDFNLIDGFRIFDINGKGTVFPNEIKSGLETLGLFIDNDDILTFVNKYDNDHDGKMKYSDFCDAFIPKDENAAKVLKDKSPYNIYTNDNRDKYFSPQTRALFRQAFKSHFDFIRLK